MHEQGLPGRQARPAVQAEPAGLVSDVQGGGLGVVQRLGRGKDRTGADDRALGEGPGGQRGLREHPRADLPFRALPEREDLRAHLHTGGEGERRPHLVLAPAQQRVGEVDVRGPDPDQQFTRARRGIGHLLQPHHVAGFAVLVHSPCLHWVASHKPSRVSARPARATY